MLLTKLITYFKPKPYVKCIRGYFWTTLVPHKFMMWFRVIIGPNRFGRWTRKILFPTFMCPGYDYFNFYLNDNIAHWILDRCITNPHTQRALSEAFKNEFPASNIDSGCQYDGQWLQRYCEDYLNVNIEKLQQNSPEYHAAIKATAERLKQMFKKIMEK